VTESAAHGSVAQRLLLAFRAVRVVLSHSTHCVAEQDAATARPRPQSGDRSSILGIASDASDASRYVASTPVNEANSWCMGERVFLRRSWFHMSGPTVVRHAKSESFALFPHPSLLHARASDISSPHLRPLRQCRHITRAGPFVPLTLEPPEPSNSSFFSSLPHLSSPSTLAFSHHTLDASPTPCP
jgi:hypothetical protein